MSVTIESLDYYNGFTYRECHMPLTNQGLIYLNGLNGAGKSTPFEVMQHILFGTTSRGVKKDGITCAVPDTDGFLGELVLRNPDGRWLIRQARNHSKYKTIVKVYRDVDGKWSTRWDGGGCPKKMDDAQKLAGSLLGLQLHEFGGCMYLSQTSAHTLIEGTPGDKMRYIAQLFGLDVCDRMLVWLREQLKAAERDAADAPALEAQLARLNAERDSYDAPRAEDLTVLQSAVDTAQERRNSLRQAIYDARDQLAEARQAEQLREQRAELGDTGDPKALKERAGRLGDKRDLLLERRRHIAERADVLNQLDRLPAGDLTPEQIDEQLDRLRTTQEELAAARTRLECRDDAQTKLARLLEQGAGNDPDELRRQLDAAQQQMTAAALASQAKRDEMARLAEAVDNCTDGTCPTCHQALDVSRMREMLGRCRQELPELDERAVEAAKRRKALGSSVELAEQRRRLEGELASLEPGDLEATQDALRDAQRRFRELQGARATAIDRAALERRLASLPTFDVAETDARLSRVEALIEGVTEELERAGEAAALDRQLRTAEQFDVAAGERFCERAEAELQRVEDAGAAVAEMLTRAEVAADDYKALCGEVSDVELQLAELAGPRRRVHVLTYSVAAIQKLKRRKLHQVVESIRDCMPRFTSTMFSHEPGTRFAVSSDDESLDLICRRQVDGRSVDIPVKSLSGGEKQRLSVALVFTLHALLHARKRPDLLILDEVDRGLDDVGIASLMSLVRSVRQQYGTVIMTSHRSQIAGAAFDQTWTVVKTNEVSRLTTNGGSEC